MADDNQTLNTIELATELTIAWLNNPNNRVGAEDVPGFLQKMHGTLNTLSTGAAHASSAPVAEHVPAVSVRKSLASKDHIISLIDGKPYKTLRRHLSTHGLTPADYRQRYNLKPDYPMVAENYSEHRRAMAKKIGLGSKGRAARAAAPADATPAKAAAKPAKSNGGRGRRKVQRVTE
jgi:predicted transcriptional regulator